MALSGTLALSACAHVLPVELQSAPPEVQFMAKALEADEDERQQLWERLRESEPGRLTEEQSRLRKALLRSMPGHDGYSPELAKDELHIMWTTSGSGMVRNLASIRLSVLKEIEERLSSIADIERQMSNGDKE